MTSRVDPVQLAARAGVSREAVDLLAASEVVDLHLESFIPTRLWGYDLHARHDGRFPFGFLFGHLDLPRVHAGGLTAAMWSIATNIARPPFRRAEVLAENVQRLASILRADPNVAIVRDASELRQARADGRHAALLAVQGGNAFDAPDDVYREASGLITRVTVVHLSTSSLGATSSPFGLGRDGGLSARGREFVQALDARRVFVDLAHVSPRGFWDAMDAHDRTLPAICTHTGLRAEHDHWRNLDDRQVRAIAETGGVVGVMVHGAFLGRAALRRGGSGAAAVVRHLEAVMHAGGEAAAAIGTDYDGFIVPPKDLRDGELAYARLVQAMLNARWKPDRIQRVLGTNFLTSFASLRP